MRRPLIWVMNLAAGFAFIGGCVSLLAANDVYDEANRWFLRATYNAECGSPAMSSACAEIYKQEPTWPYGVEVTDKDVLLAEASALHSTGSGVLALGGLLMGTSGVLLTGTTIGQRMPTQNSSTTVAPIVADLQE